LFATSKDLVAVTSCGFTFHLPHPS